MEIINRDEVIDQLEAVLFNCPQIDCPLVHRFTPGMYIREIFMPAGTMLTSMIHKTEHPYVVSKGKVNVEINGVIENIEAPFFGITKPGTRRVLYILEDTVWTTFHALPMVTGEEKDKDLLVSKIIDLIIEPHDNKYLSEDIKKQLK